MGSRFLNGKRVVDLDRPLRPSKVEPPPTPRRRPRRQCAHCFTNRISILQWALKGCEDRALHALRVAHPEEYEELLQRERDAAEAATAQSWELHLDHKCARATRVAGTATNHRDSPRRA